MFKISIIEPLIIHVILETKDEEQTLHVRRVSVHFLLQQHDMRHLVSLSR